MRYENFLKTPPEIYQQRNARHLLVTVLVSLSLFISGCGGGSQTGDHTDKDNYALAITPANAFLTARHSVHLAASSPWGSGAYWSVSPASAGTIDQSGNFTASDTTGEATITAMWLSDVRYTAMAKVTVVSPPVANIDLATPPVIDTPGTATVPAQSDSTYVWSIQGGTIVSGQGTPQIRYTTTGLGQVQASCEVTNAAGDSVTTVIVIPPSIQYTPSTYTFTRGLVFSPVLPSNSGGAATSWSIEPGLPIGLNFDASTGIITGTPERMSPATTFTVTASNNGGHASTSVVVRVVDPPPVIHYAQTAQTFVRGAEINSIVPTNTGGNAVSWEISPSLPDGLRMDSNSGVISGTPSTPAEAATFSVTASNSGGTSNTVELTFTVVDSAPVFSYARDRYVFTINRSAETIAPTLTHGTATAWSISPALPAGLVLDTVSGTISGIPTVLSPNVSYTVTARNDYGSRTIVEVGISVVDVPPRISYTPSTFTLTRGNNLAAITPANSGGPATSFSIAPALPDGLVFNTATGDITGAPNVIRSSGVYLVTASNSGGTSDPASLTITVVDVIPVIQYRSSTLVITKDSSVLGFTPTNSGGPATSWNIQPQLPSDMVFDELTGLISGTPRNAVSNLPYSITAANSGGTSQPFSLLLSVVLPPTSTLTTSSQLPPYGATVDLLPTFSNSVSAVIGTTAGGEDISASPNSGVPITTAAIRAEKTYWLRAMNAAGDHSDSSVTVAPQTVVVSGVSPERATRTVETSTTFHASVTGGATNGITWTASAGTIDAATGQWTAPETAGNVTITATSQDDASKSASTVVDVVLTSTASLNASTTTPLYGATIELTPTFANAATATIGTTLGGSDIAASPTSGLAITTAPLTGSKIYWLRVTNAAGDFVDVSVPVNPQTVAVDTISPVAPSRTVGTSTTFSTSVTGGVTNGITWTASAGTIDAATGQWTAPATPSNVTITATSQDDPSKSASTVVSVLSAVTASITASSTNPLHGATVNLTPTFTNASTATIGTTRGGNDVSSSASTGVQVTTAPIITGKTYWLRATNAAGDFVDSSVTVTSQTVVVNAISPATPTRTVSTSTTFSTTATGGVTNGITWTASAGTIDAATGQWTAPATPGTVTITATSQDDSSKSANTVVSVVSAATASITASSTNPLHGATVNLTPTFTNATSARIGTTQGGNDVSSSSSSGVQVTTAAITSSKTYWLRATNAAGDFVDSSVTVTPQTVVVNAISPATPTRTVSTSTTFSTTVTGGVTNGITWTASAGTIDAATGQWTAPATPGTVTITATSQDDSSKSANTVVSVVSAATASITASSTNPLHGATVNLTPTFTNAASARIGTTQGGNDISNAPTSNVAIATTAITTTRTYWLRATNVAGDAVDSSVTVTPQTVVVNAISPATPTKTVSTSTTFSTTVTGGATNGITWSASAGTMNANTGAWTAPVSSGNVTITATSKDDATKNATTTVNVVLAATASITASSTSPLYGATVNLTPTFTNSVTASVGTAQGASDVSNSPTSGTAITSSPLTTPKTFWLRATNSAGDPVDGSVTVTPKTVTVGTITKGANTVSVGYTTTARATVTNATDTSVNWTANGGSFSPTNTASGVNTTWTAPASPGTYTLTATSAADASKKSTATVSVVALPVATSLTPSTTSPLYGATVNLTPIFSSGTGSVNQGVGTVTNNVAKASSALTVPTTFTLTVTNTAGQTATASSALVTPQTVSVDVPTQAQNFLTTGNSQTYSTSVHGAVNTSVTWSSGGAGSWSGATWTAPSTAGTYTITATSVADPTKSNNVTVNVVDPPVITSFIANDPIVSLNHSTALKATFTNGNGTAQVGITGTGSSEITSSATSNIDVPTGNLTTTTTFTLTVYNEAGSSTTASLTVTVVIGSSSTVATLSGARYAHSSTLLPDGRVLIVGGRNDSAPLDSSQIYDPTTEAASDAGTMPSSRYGHTATLLPNNKVLLAGGNNGVTTGESEIWNGGFTVSGTLNTPREKHTATLLPNGKVLLVGGLNGSSPIVSAELFDPSTGAFSYTAGNLNTARYNHTATLLGNGKVLIAGGYNGSVALKSAELFDPSTGVFTAFGNMTTARQRHVAVLLDDGKVAIIGGRGTSAPLASAEIFNPSGNTFAATSGSMANARDNLTATLVASGKVIVAGGVNGSGVPVVGCEVLDPTAGTFGLTTLLASARSQHTATILQNGNIFVAGGVGGSGATGAAELIDPQDGLSPTIPNATITAPVGALRSQTGLSASVASQTHTQYVWMITGGTITSGQGTRSITFSMPSSGTATLDSLAVSDRIVPSHAQFVVTPKPVISAFAAQRATVTVEGSTNLNWTVEDATALSIDQGVGTVSGSSTLVTVGSLGTTTYTLTATNAGGSVTASTSVLAVPPPIAASLTPALTSVPVGGNTNLTPIFSQGTGSISPSIGAVLSGPAYPTPAISTPTTFTLTVTNAAGDVAQQSTTVGLDPVVVTGITGPQYVTAGHKAVYSATVSGSVNTSVVWQTSAGTIDGTGLTAPTGAPYDSAQTPVTITATSVNGGTPATFTVQVVPLPVITSFTSSPSTANYGGSTTITPVFSMGSGQIVGFGSVTSGQGVSTGNLTTAKTFRLTVTNIAGDSVSQDLTVNQTTPGVTTPSPASQTVTTGDQVTFTASTTGSANTAVTWSADGGSFSGNRWTAPSAGTYTITASSVSPAGYSASTTITVVAAPAISGFTATPATIASGSTANLQATYSGGTATVSPGSTSPTSGVPFATSALASTTIYTLTVTNAAGRSVSRTVTVNVVKGVSSDPGDTMSAIRAGHTVTLLADGRVLIAGGSATASADLSDATGQNVSAVASPMQAVRYYHTATLLADGSVLLAGGADGSGVSQSSAEIFNPSGATFVSTNGTMLIARQKHTATLMSDGRVLISGGLDASGNSLLSAEIYDPHSKAFTAAPAMSSPREFATSTRLTNGNVLVVGGDDTTAANTSAELFNGSTYASYALSTARTMHSATLLSGGSVFVAGGTDLATALDATEIFSGTSFGAAPIMPSARYGHAASLLASGLVLIAGGTTDGAVPTQNSIVFDPYLSTYWPTGSLTAPRFQPASTILRNGHVLITGGSSDTSTSAPAGAAMNTIEIYDPQDSLTPALPSAALTAPSSASDGAVGLTASVPSQSNVSYVWSLTNGTITSGLNTRSITFTHTSGVSVLSVLVISDRQIPVQSSVNINPAPTIASFTATPSTNTTGLPTTLAWTATGAPDLTLSINKGIGDVTGSSSTVVTTPAVTTTYTLTATDSNGTATRNVTLTAVPMPTATGLTAAVNPVEKGSSTTIVPVFTTNGSAFVNNGVGTVLSGVAYPTGVLNGSTTFTLTSTNSVGTTATFSTTVNVMPVAVGTIAGPTNVTVSSTSAQFTAAVTGAVDKTVTWSVSSGSISSAGLLTAPASPQDIVVTATSVADPSVHNQITVHVVPEALALSITAAVNPVLYGGTTTITPHFAQGTGTINQGIGSVTDGIAYTTGTITADKIFTLTVTNASGDTATFPYTVRPQDVVVSTITGPASGKVTVSHTATFSATVSGAVNTSLTWSSGGAGSWSGATWTAPATPGNYTITAMAVDGSTNTLAIGVVAAPAITAFVATPPGVNKNQSSLLSATFSGAGTGANVTGIVTPGNLALASDAGSVSTGALTESQTYTLTVTNDAGDTASSQVTVQIFLGAFSATSNGLTPGRNLPATILLPDGNVLVAGGGTATSSVDLFNSTTLSLSTETALLTGRNGHTTTLLPNGRVLVAGGWNGLTALATAELYNPADGTFSPTGALVKPRKNHRAILLDSGKVLLIGGTGESTAELYDPATGTFSATNSMATVRDSASLSRLPDGRILVAGGSNGTTRLASAEIYDPSTNSFSTAATMAKARQFHTATTLPSGQVLIAGGTGSSASGSAEIFNPSLMRFVSTGDMVQPRQEHVAALLAGGMVLLAGGNTGASATAIDQAELYDTSRNAFLKTDFMSATGSPATGSAATILRTGQVLVTGGTSDGTNAVVGSELYTPTDGVTANPADPTITTSAFVPQGATGVSAHVTAAAGARYYWMVTNGVLVSGQGTASITFNMPATGNAALDVLIVTDRFVPSHANVSVVGEPAPAISSFTAVTNPVPYGGSTTLTGVFSNATASAMIGTGSAGSSDIAGSVTSGVGVPVGPLTTPVQYRLTTTNRAGVSVNQTLTVGVQSIIVSAISPANSTVSLNSTRTFSATVSQAVNTGITWTASGGSMDSATGIWTAPSTPGTYNIVAIANADGATSSSTTVTVVALPVIQGFTASPNTVNFGQSATLTPQFTGAIGNQAKIGTSGMSSSQLTSSAVSGAGVSTGSLTTDTVYTLTVTNAAGDSATATAQVSVNQQFASAAPMLLPRLGQTMTMLPGGALLVAGGTGAADRAELFSNGTFTATQPMIEARAHHTATLLANGRVLFAGGANAAGNELNSAEIFDPLTGAFTATQGLMAHARRNHVASLLPDGRVLIAAGFNSTDHQLADAEIFDPLTGSFSAVGTSLSNAREFATATTLVDGRVLIAGGFNGTADQSAAQAFANGSFVIPEVTMGAVRSHHVATLLTSGQVLVAGGRNGSSTLSSAELFTAGTPGNFSGTGAMGTPRQDASACLLADGDVLVAGGSDGTTTYASAELFDPSAANFTGTSSMITARSNASCGLLPNGTLLLAGGTSDGSTPLASAEVFDPQDGQTPYEPDATITPSASHAYAGATGISASVQAHAGNRYVWEVRNGTITSGQGTATVTFNMAGAGDAIIDVLVITDRHVPAHSNVSITSDPLPRLDSFTATDGTVPYGGTTNLTATFANAAVVTLGTAGYGSSNVSGSVTSGASIPVGPLTSTTTFTLTLPAANGIQTSADVTVNVLPVVVSPVTPASTIITAGRTATFTATVSQAVNTDVSWSATGGSIDGNGTWTAPSTPGTYTITATASADGITSTSTNVTVVALPIIQSFSSSSSSVSYGQTVTLTPEFSAPSGSVAMIGTTGAGSSQVSGNAISGIGLSSGPLADDTTFTLTVTNSAGDSVTQTAHVSVNQFFSLTAPMTRARVRQTVTALADGTVLVAGGTSSADPAEIYSANSETFTLTSPMQAARKGHSATLLADGRVLIAGGFDGNNVLSSAEIFDPSTGVFTAASGTMIHPRQNHMAVLLQDGRVLLMGGSNSTENQLASAEIFNPATGSFADAGSSMQEAREFATATAMPNGDVLITGGNGTSGTPLYSAELYTAGNFLSHAFPMHYARSKHTATLLPSGEVLIAGGTDGSRALQTAELYTGGSTGASWTEISTSMSFARYEHSASVLVSGKVLLAGGTDGSSMTATGELFDPDLQSFTPIGNLRTPRAGAGSSLLRDGRVLIVGGSDADSNPLSSAELFSLNDGLAANMSALNLIAPDTAPFASSQNASIQSPAGSRTAWWVENGRLELIQNEMMTFTTGAAGDSTVYVLVIDLGLPRIEKKQVSGY